MKRDARLVLMALSLAAPGLASARSDRCGDPGRVAAFYKEAVYAADRSEAESRLIEGLFPVVSCLSRDGFLEQPSGLKGRFAVVLEVLAVLRRQSLRLSSPDDIDRQLRLWKLRSAAPGEPEEL